VDQVIFDLINGWAGQSESLDSFVYYLNKTVLFKGIPPMMLFWFLWFLPADAASRYREKLMALLVIAIAAILVGRILQIFLPIVDRPVNTPNLSFNLPLADYNPPGPDWSSFPSDHAVLFFAVATCFWFVNKYAGMVAYLHAFAIVTIPRIFLAMHWPSDILGGLVVGAAIALLLMRPVTRVFSKVSDTKVFDRYEYLLYPVLFFLTFQIATMFDSARWFASAAFKAVRQLVS